MRRPFPLQVQNAYADLLERHVGRPRPRFEGSFRKRKRRNKEFWEVRRRVGQKQKTEHIGPDNEKTRALIEELRAEQAADKAFRRSATRLVQMIVKAGAPAPDRETGALLRALASCGAFRLGAVLIGTHAYRMYEAVLGVSLGASGMSTEDVDIARDREVQVASNVGPDPALEYVLGALRLEPQFSRLTERGVWQWRALESDLLVEFLTPLRSTDRQPVKLQGLGVHAMQLPYLEYLLQEPLDAVALYHEGVLVSIPNPIRFAIHKIIVSTSRGVREAGKVAKDRMQAAALLDVLIEDHPLEVEENWNAAVNAGQRWKKALKSGAKSLPSALKEKLRELDLDCKPAAARP